MIALNKSYAGYAQGAIAEFGAELELALIAQGIASTTLLTVASTGPITTSELKGSVVLAIAAASIVVTHPACNAGSRVLAYISQAAADATALRIERVVTASGSFTIYATAAATAATVIDFQLFP